MASATTQQGDPTSSPLFEWPDFLDFDIDEVLGASFLHSELGAELEEEPELDKSQPPENLERVRKRDPRLLCPNFVSGLIPCACPELDKQLEEEEESALPGKKRARVGRASTGFPMRCQVPGCEADISKLKGYHKRYRVCLQCANANSVVLDGEESRYCQQCGKFHILSNFDEGKRSCRRKLNMHNDRRRRKFTDPKGGIGKEAQHATFAATADDGENDGTSPSSQNEEREMFLDSDRHVSRKCSDPGLRNLQGDSVVSSDAPGEIQNNGQKKIPKFTHATSNRENKNKFSSVCPTGRISFKLYDWNPAEFPRRLRLQILEWMSSMPIELEGYIRPGCTILTAFIAMPKSMWLKLLEKPTLYIRDFVASPGNMLSGRGTMLVYLNDMMFRVTKDSILQVSLKDRSPKLHYIYPTCFEAGKPMEFVACGSNLLQPKFRFLVSFAGQYLAYNICVSSLCCKKGNNNYFDHQLVKISIPQTDENNFGPAFIEVENQSGLSNFIPILIGDKETCAEFEILQQKFDASQSSQVRQLSPQMPTCEVLVLRQSQFSGFLLDVAWSLKKPASEQPLTSSHIQRFNSLLDFLIEKEAYVILERVVCSLKSTMDNNVVCSVSDLGMMSLQEKIGIARSMFDRKIREKVFPLDDQLVIPATKTGTDGDISGDRRRYDSSSLDANGVSIPLIKEDVIMDVRFHARPRKFCGSRMAVRSRQLIMSIAIVCVCFAVCAALLHPQRVSRITTTIRRCLFDSS